MLKGEFGFWQLIELEVANANAEPDVRWRFWIQVDHGFQILQSLLIVAFIVAYEGPSELEQRLFLLIGQAVCIKSDLERSLCRLERSLQQRTKAPCYLTLNVIEVPVELG